MLLAALLVVYVTGFETVSAASTPIATSTIISKITTQLPSTSSSIISTSTTTSSFDSCSTTTDSDGNSSAECKGGQALVESTVYASGVVTLTSVYDTTVGYSTIYSSVTDQKHSDSSSRTGSKMSTTGVLTSSLVTSPSSLTTSTTFASEASQDTTTSNGSSSPSTAKGTQSSTASSSQTSTADLSQSSTAADNGLFLESSGMKAVIVVVILASIALVCGVAYWVVKRRRNRKAHQAIFGDKTMKSDVEKTEMRVLIDRRDSEKIHGKSGLYPQPFRSASNASSLYTIASFEMSADTKIASFYGSQATQKYEMVASTTPIYELDSGDYEFKDVKN